MLAEANVVIGSLPVLGAGNQICDLVVRIDDTRRAEISWDGRQFAEARWVGSGLSHVYSLTGGVVAPPGANAPSWQIIERALLEIELAAQSSVRALAPPPRTSVKRAASATPPPRSDAMEQPAPALEQATWEEPANESDAAVRRQATVAAMGPIDGRLQVINASLPGSSGATRAALTSERARLAQQKAELVQELQHLKLWRAQRGMDAPCGEKGPLWDVLRKCHKLLERMSGEATGFADDIEMCLDAIEYVVPKRFLDESEQPRDS